MKTENFGGAERLQQDYFKRIDFGRYTISFGVNSDIFSDYLQKNNLPVELILLPKLNKAARFFEKFRAYWRFFSHVKPHCIVFNQFFLESFTLAEVIAAFLITKGNAYMIVHDCPPLPPWGKRYFKRIPANLSYIKERLHKTLLGFVTKKTLAVSEAAKKILVNNYKFPAGNVRVTYHGVDIEEFVPSRENKTRLRQKFNLSESDTIIVSTAMLYPIKRLDRLLKGFEVLAGQRRDIQLLLVGSGSEHQKLMDMVNSFSENVRKQIKFLGFRKDILSFLQLSDIFVLTSDSEGLPLACLEAMACGLISVVTDCGGTSEIIKDGINGFLTEKNPEGIFLGLQRALNLNNAQRQAMAMYTRKYIEEKFDLKRNICSGLNLLKLSPRGGL